MTDICKLIRASVFACAVAVSATVSARTFEFRALGAKATGERDSWWGSNSNKALFQLKVGGAQAADSKDEMEIRAATVIKNTSSKVTGVNDVATFRFRPINKGKALLFGISTGTANYVRWSEVRTWQVAGCIIEVWQAGKVVKHWSNVPGNGGKTKLTGNVKQLRIDSSGYEHTSSYSAFDNATEICAIDSKGERVDIDEVLSEFEESDQKEGMAHVEEHAGGSEPKVVDPDEFKLNSICGFVFGSQKPDLEENVVRLQRPFRHYDVARPRYGSKSGKLMEVRLESHRRFDTQEEREAEMASVAATFEKKYGIVLRDSGSSYSFYNRHVTIYISSSYIEVTDHDVEKQERLLATALREAAKSSRRHDSVQDADVL